MGERIHKLSVFAAAALLGLAASCACAAARADAAAPWRTRVSVKLLAIYDAATRGRTPVPTGSVNAPHIDATGRVQVDVHYDCSWPAPRAALTSAGLSVNATVAVPPLCVIEGWIAPARLPAIANIAGVTSVKVPSYALRPRTRPPLPPSPTLAPPASSSAPPAGGAAPRDHSAPREHSAPAEESAPPSRRQRAQTGTASAIDANGVAIEHADQFVAQTGTAGAGVTVGVQSTGVASLASIQQRGELPAVQVFTPSGQSNPPPADEGTALLEEVHAVAPAAGLAFCGPTTFVEYTSCLQRLIAAGATVLVDDLIFIGQDLMSADGADTQAVEAILAQNPSVALFTVVGNYNGSYWEGPYAPVSLASQGMPALTCPTSGGTQTDAYVAAFGNFPNQQLKVTGGGNFPLLLSWADPSNQNTSHFDLYWSSNSDPTQSGCFSAAGVDGNVITPNLNLAAGTYTLYVATPDASDSGKFLKLWVGGDGLTFLSVSTPGGIVSAQAFASGAITIGAVNGSDGIGNQIEPFSSLGPLSLVFPQPAQVQAPVLVAPDGINVDAQGTYFEGMLFPDGNFYGTSASVPNAGAVAALLRGAFPSLTVTQLVQALTTGAAQLGGSKPDDTFGHGRVDALGALATLPAPTITALPNGTIDAGASTPAYPFTVSGTGSLHFTVTSSNAALVPPAIVAAGAAGLTITPSTCGVAVMNCMVTVTAAAGAGGTTDLTLDVVDGANRTASATMTITVNGPPPSSTAPPPAASTTASGAKGGGGAFGWAGLVVLALLAAARAARSARSALKSPPTDSARQ